MLAPAAIYARVSTGEQSTEQQVAALREASDRMHLDPVLVVEETGSGARADCPGLLSVMEAARRGEVRALLVWKLDRLGRSVLDLARNVDELRRLGVRLVAVTQGIDLDPARPDPAARMAADMLAAVAEYERALIVERTRAGLDRARRKGTKSGKAIGRPRASAIMLNAAADRVRAGVSLRRAAREAGVGAATLSRFLRTHSGQGRSRGRRGSRVQAIGAYAGSSRLEHARSLKDAPASGLFVRVAERGGMAWPQAT